MMAAGGRGKIVLGGLLLIVGIFILTGWIANSKPSYSIICPTG